MEISHQYPGLLIGAAEGQREAVQPPLGEHLDGARLQPVADLLQGGRVFAGGEPVGQLGEGDPGLGGLPLGPLMPVDPDLGRVGEIGAHLDERRAEISVPQVEVVAGHPPVSLGERELRRRRAGLAPIGGPHPLELLRHPDRHDLWPALSRGPLEVRGHHAGLAVIPGELDPRDPVRLREGSHRPAELLPDLAGQRRRGDRHAQVLGHERDHLPTGLQDRHVGVEVDPVQALDAQLHVSAENLVHRHHACAHDTLRNHAHERRMNQGAQSDQPNHAAWQSEAEPHW